MILVQGGRVYEVDITSAAGAGLVFIAVEVQDLNQLVDAALEVLKPASVIALPKK